MKPSKDIPRPDAAAVIDALELVRAALCSGQHSKTKTMAREAFPILERALAPQPAFRTKLLELDASNEDGLLRLAVEDPGFNFGRSVAPFLFEDVEITIRKVTP